MLFLTFFNICKSDATASFPDPGVIESPISDFSYLPGVFNDHIGLQNVIVKSDKLIMRSTIDESSMIRWELPVPVEDWSFTFDFNELNLESRETAGLYLFFTKEKQLLGNFKGGTSIFHGFMAGIEFSGKSVELNYTINDGKDYKNIGEYVIKVDSLNPNRFKNIKHLKVKVINTKNNFKIEIYDNDKVIYDNFRFFGLENLKNSKKGYYLSLFAEYKHVSSAKAFELTNASLYKRNETSEYSTTHLRMEQFLPIQKKKEDVLHPNNDVNELIYSTHVVTSFIKSMLGDLPDTSISNAEKELIKEIDSLGSKIDKLKGLKSKKKEAINFISNLNVLDLKLKGLEKLMAEVDYLVENIKENQNKKFSIFETVAIFICMFLALVLGAQELSSFLSSRTKN